MDLEITDTGERPVGSKKGFCFYCNSKAGDHADDCICVKRSVVVRMIIEYVVAVPRSWSKDQVEFHRNKGSWCADSDINDLADSLDESKCGCISSRFEFLREASQQNHLRLPVLIKEEDPA